MKRWVVLALFCLLPVTAEASSNVLTWTDNSPNEALFNVERKAEACAAAILTFAEIATVTANVTTFNDALVTEGVTYCYRVRATNSAGSSGYSNTAGRTVPFTVPIAPSGLGVIGGP